MINRPDNYLEVSQCPLLFEIQRGEYFGEDDIERFEDDFGRS